MPYSPTPCLYLRAITEQVSGHVKGRVDRKMDRRVNG